jgi:hypothetical protein
MDDKDYINLDDLQLNLDLDNMNGYSAQSALTISSASVDTITLGSIGAVGSSGTLGGISGQYNYNYGNISPGITISNTTGGSGQLLTTGTNGLTWADFGQNNISRGSLQVKGDAEFDGDVKIKGVSIAETLEKLEQRLAILRPNEQLEDKWEELKALGDAYRKLEADIIEKQKMWDILKK